MRLLFEVTNLPFSEGPTIFSNAAIATALIDRLVHHAEILTLEGVGDLRIQVPQRVVGERSQVDDRVESLEVRPLDVPKVDVQVRDLLDAGTERALLEEQRLCFEVGLAELFVLSQISSFSGRVSRVYPTGVKFSLVIGNMCAPAG